MDNERDELVRLVLALWGEQAAVLGLPGPGAGEDEDEVESWLANQAGLTRDLVLAAARGDVAALAIVRQVAGLPLVR